MLSKIMQSHIPVDINRMRKTNFIESQRQIEMKKVRMINEGHGWKTVNRCPLCGSKEFQEEFKKYESPLLMCKGCEIRYHQRIPSNLNDVYNDPTYELYTMEDSEEHFNYRKERFGRERVRLIEDICGPLDNLRILDVGCGNGFFLAAAKEKCKNCFGSEFSAINRKKAEKNTGLPIYPDPLENFPEKGFDIITAFDVIEHIEFPLQFIRAAKNLLNAGGFIVLFTPNFDSFSVKVMKEYSSIVDPTEHLILFSHNSLKILAELLGLNIVYMATKGLDIFSILSYLSFLGEENSRFLFQYINELQAIIDVAGAADYLRVIYQKRDNVPEILEVGSDID